MSKTIRLTDDVYAALRARSVATGNTLSETVYALLTGIQTESRLSAVETRISKLEAILLSEELQETIKIQTSARVGI